MNPAPSNHRSPRPLDYGRPETPMPAAVQWLLGVPMGFVVVAVVGGAFTASQGPVPGICAALVAVGLLGMWIVRLRRGGHYGAMAAAVLAGAATAIAALAMLTALLFD